MTFEGRETSADREKKLAGHFVERRRDNSTHDGMTACAPN